MNIDPYTPIRKVPLNFEGIKSSAYSVQLKNNSNSFEEVGTVSNNYLLIENKEVKTLVDDMTESTGWDWEVTREYFDGKKFMYSLMAKDKTKELDVGDTVGLGISAWNSYDGSASFNVKLMAYRLECLNGMMSDIIFNKFRFRHDKSSEDYAKELGNFKKYFNTCDAKLEEFANACNSLLTSLELEDLRTIRKQYLQDIPVTLFGKFFDEYTKGSEEYGRTAWDFTNAATNVLWHNKKPTYTDFKHNKLVVDKMLEYAWDCEAEKAADSM